jgi:hypothetical protein
MSRAVLIALAALLALAGPASASVLRGSVPDGIPHHPQHPVARAANLPYGGGPVLHRNRTHLVFWNPAGAGLSFDPGYGELFQTFLGGVAHDSHTPANVYSLTGQYHDSAGAAVYASTYAGAIADTDPLPARDISCQESVEGPAWPDCVTDTQIQAELAQVVAVHHLPVTLGDIYVLVTPNGLADCDTSSVPASCSLGGPDFNGYCAYHSATGAGLLYAVIPYNAVPNHCASDGPRPNGSTADPGLSSLSHEHNETITDPLGDGWIDGTGNEDGDLCIDTVAHPPKTLGHTPAGAYDQIIAGHRYWLQGEWSNAAAGCATSAPSDSLRLGLPRTITAGTKAVFSARASRRVVSLQWSFGDGGNRGGFKTAHTFRRSGHYRLTVRGTDSFGNWVYARSVLRVRAAPVHRRRG